MGELFVADEGFDGWQLDARRGVDDTDEVDEAVLDPTAGGTSPAVLMLLILPQGENALDN